MTFRTSALFALAMAAIVGLTACGNDDDDDRDGVGIESREENDADDDD